MKHALARLLVRLASLATPPPVRDRFREEWEAELWYARRRSDDSGPGVVGSALGAFKDARAVRRFENHGTRRRGTMGTWIAGWRGDLAQAARGLGRTPLFSGVAVLTLALGMGGSVAVYTLLDRVVLDPLPYPASDRLVRLKNQVPCVGPGTEWDMSSAQFFFLRGEAKELEAVGAYGRGGVNVRTPEGPRRARMARVSHSVVALTGARPHVGRLIDADDDRPGAPDVVVLSHGFWTRHFGGDPGVVGSMVEIYEQPREVIGVLERGASLPPEPNSAGAADDVWVPLRLDPAGPFHNNHAYPMFARLAPGTSMDGARTELDRLTDRLPETFPSAYSRGFVDDCGFHTVLYPLKEHVLGDMTRHVWILFGAVGLVLLIAGANVANLFLVRTEGRRREVALRSALGAGRGEIVRYLLAESLLVSGGGALLALLVGYGGLSALVALAPSTLPRLPDTALDPSGVAVVGVLALATALVLAMLPAVRHRGPEVRDILGVGGGQSPARLRLRSSLVAGQVALALTLAVGAGLLLETVGELRRVDPGFDPAGALAVDLYPAPPSYQSTEALWGFYGAVLDQVEGLPGVASAGMSQGLPLEERFACTVQGFEDRGIYARLRERDLTTCAGQMSTTPGYFQAMGVPLVAGRTFTDGDNLDPGRGAVVVSEAFAERFWPGEDPLGKGIAPSGLTEGPFYHVVGVVGNVPAESLVGETAIAVYYPVVRIPGSGGWWPGSMTMVVRTELADPLSLVAPIRNAVRDLDPSIPLANVREVESLIENAMSRVAFTALLLQVAAAMAVLLAAVGLYGVMAYLVTRRRREIGTRMALGARARQVEGLVVRTSLGITLLGVAAGTLLALATTRILRGLLYGVEPTDPMAFAGAALMVTMVALLASWIPARRAARVDPVEALRAD